MALDIDLRLRLGRLELAAALRVEPGEMVAVLGPNGAGKTTLLRAVAGLQPVDEGRITVDGAVLDDPSNGTFVPPERRPVGVVFQDHLLFATMSALENVAFGLRARGVHRREAREIAGGWLDRVGLGSYAGERPGALSGGQSQRVALARALAIDPRVLVLDEPLAALDAAARPTVRRDLRRHLESFDGMRLMVTHDPVDAYALADRIVVLEAGRVTQAGRLADVTAHPRSHYVAQLVGLNLVRGRFADHRLLLDSGAEVVTADAVAEGPAFAAIRPQAVSLHRHRPEGSARNVWHLTVDDVDQRHDRTRVALIGELGIVAEITPTAFLELGLRPGEQVWATVKATDITTYPA